MHQGWLSVEVAAFPRNTKHQAVTLISSADWSQMRATIYHPCRWFMEFVASDSIASFNLQAKNFFSYVNRIDNTHSHCRVMISFAMSKRVNYIIHFYFLVYHLYEWRCIKIERFAWRVCVCSCSHYFKRPSCENTRHSIISINYSIYGQRTTLLVLNIGNIFK